MPAARRKPAPKPRRPVTPAARRELQLAKAEYAKSGDVRRRMDERHRRYTTS